MLKKPFLYTSGHIRIIMTSLMKYDSSACGRFDPKRNNFRSLECSTIKLCPNLILKGLQNSFSTITKTINETQVLDEQFKQGQIIDKQNEYQQRDLNSNEQKEENNEKYVDYLRIFQQNKKRLQLASQICKHKDQGAPQTLFDQIYLRDNLIETKYFYADIVNVTACVVENLINRIECSSQQESSSIVTPIHLHLLLYVYHLYPQEFRSLKERMIRIMDYFFYCSDSTLGTSFKMEDNLQLFVYFRKFIEIQISYGNGKQLSTLIQKYCLFLRECYQNEKKTTQPIFKKNEDKDKQVHQATLRAELIHNYLLAFPNVWILTKKISQQDRINQKQVKGSLSLSKQTIGVFDSFVSQFSTLFNVSIQSWMNNNASNNSALTSNNSLKAQLTLQFKQLQLNKCYNQIKLIIHRLFEIVQVPHKLTMTRNNIKESTNKGKINREMQNQAQQQMSLIYDQYINGKINLLNYLPSSKFTQQKQIKMMRLLILIKNLLSHHVLKHINYQKLTNYLVQLFQQNPMIINSANQDIRRDIHSLIGELISRLSSGSWVDHDDRLNKYFVNSNIHNQQTKNQKHKDKKGGWYGVNDS